MGYYNWRVFGSPTVLPYQINRSTYAVSPYFLWQSPRPEPLYRHKVMRDFYAWELSVFRSAHTVTGFYEGLVWRLTGMVYFYIGPVAALTAIMLPRVARDRRIRFLLVAAAILAIGMLLTPFFMAHYMSPATSLVYALMLQSMRHVRRWKRNGKASGVFLTRAIPVTQVFLCCLYLGGLPFVPTAGVVRSEAVSELEKLPGRQLAIVRYALTHNPHNEWVYNAADIDASRVVWARDMGAQDNAELIDYFKDRTVWIVEPDLTPPRFTRYSR